jgi:hypothetical protein
MSNGGMTDSWWICMSLEGSGCGLINVLYRNCMKIWWTPRKKLSRWSGRDSKWTSPEHESKALILMVLSFRTGWQLLIGDKQLGMGMDRAEAQKKKKKKKERKKEEKRRRVFGMLLERNFIGCDDSVGNKPERLKVKLPLPTRWWQTAGGAEIQRHLFVTLALDWGKCSISHPCRLPPGKDPGSHWIRGCVGPRTSLYSLEKRKSLVSTGIRNPDNP